MKSIYDTVRFSDNIDEIISIIRTLVPGVMETGCIVYNLERNVNFDARLRLELACVLSDKYHSFELVDDIIKCAANTELLKRLYESNVDCFDAFVAVNITSAQEIEKMYQSGVYDIQLAAVSNEHVSTDFLKKFW